MKIIITTTTNCRKYTDKNESIKYGYVFFYFVFFQFWNKNKHVSSSALSVGRSMFDIRKKKINERKKHATFFYFQFRQSRQTSKTTTKRSCNRKKCVRRSHVCYNIFVWSRRQCIMFTMMSCVHYLYADDNI